MAGASGRGGRRALLLIAGGIVAVGIAGAAYFAAPANRSDPPIDVASNTQTAAVNLPPEAPSHMARPDSGFHMYVAYFEEHQVGDAMNQDVAAAVRLAAADVKASGQSLVITCHGDDAVAGNPNLNAHDLRRARFQALRDDLIAQGLTSERIKDGWGDAALTAVAEKKGPKSQASRPNCYIETAVPTSLD